MLKLIMYTKYRFAHQVQGDASVVFGVPFGCALPETFLSWLVFL